MGGLDFQGYDEVWLILLAWIGAGDLGIRTSRWPISSGVFLIGIFLCLFVLKLLDLTRPDGTLIIFPDLVLAAILWFCMGNLAAGRAKDAEREARFGYLVFLPVFGWVWLAVLQPKT
ncbi:hypothetical protein ACSBLW_13795 [Thioclava sp. FR2]|uniref:hypothetical protein n=1 Tax=Thioclava sp. FR2 TaxID=3445780 RepID=UPI003EB9A29F